MHTQAMNIALPQWGALAIAGEPLSSLLADLRTHRAPSALGDLLMDAVTLADIYEDCDQLISLDAIIVPFKTINRKMAALMQAMKRTGTDVHPVKVDISEPFTQRGSAHVASLFTLSDGQTITVFFHNPDTTPKRIKPTDEMVSWKWLLNKKDVTITVAAEHGQDLKVQDVARRVMLLAQKNSTAFKRLNAKKSERDATIQGLKDEVTMLEATLKHERELLEAAKAGDGLGKSEPVAISGDELGEFPDTEDGKKALREAAIDYFRKNLETIQGGVLNRALDVRVAFNGTGRDHVQSKSADRRKLKLVVALDKIVADGKPISGSPFKPHDRAAKRGVNKTHVLRTQASINGESETVRFVLHEDAKGHFFYDHSIDSEEYRAAIGGNAEARDSAVAADLNLPALLSDEPSSEYRRELTLDRTDSAVNGMVLNLFIEGEDPEEVQHGDG
jgi:hypothetical protein